MKHLARDIKNLVVEATVWAACLTISASLAAILIALISVALAVIESDQPSPSPGARLRWGKIDYEYQPPVREELSRATIDRLWQIRQGMKRAHQA